MLAVLHIRDVVFPQATLLPRLLRQSSVFNLQIIVFLSFGQALGIGFLDFTLKALNGIFELLDGNLQIGIPALIAFSVILILEHLQVLHEEYIEEETSHLFWRRFVLFEFFTVFEQVSGMLVHEAFILLVSLVILLLLAVLGDFRLQVALSFIPLVQFITHSLSVTS